jgi:hypothetical protein
MNLGVVIFALFVMVASLMGIFMIASQNQVPITDSFGQTQSIQVNNTSALLENTTAPIANSAGGLVLILGVFALFVVAYFVYKSVGSAGGRR